MTPDERARVLKYLAFISDDLTEARDLFNQYSDAEQITAALECLEGHLQDAFRAIHQLDTRVDL
jgi:hypothetical protein